MTIHPAAAIHKVTVLLMATLKPLGVWGLGCLAFIDSGLFPLPTTMDGVLIGYVAANHRKFFLYCLMAALTSALGSLIPYAVGRAGGELFLLKRINRARYEALRDKFERQEFMAIMIPAMMPPPMPIKLFEFAAGVFEMKPMLFALAIFVGKFVQFLACALVTVFYGPTIVNTFRHTLHDQPAVVICIVGIAVVGLAIYILRKIFAGRGGTRFPIEDIPESEAVLEVEEEDPTLIT